MLRQPPRPSCQNPTEPHEPDQPGNGRQILDPERTGAWSDCGSRTHDDNQRDDRHRAEPPMLAANQAPRHNEQARRTDAEAQPLEREGGGGVRRDVIERCECDQDCCEREQRVRNS